MEQIALVLYPGSPALDSTGPFQVLVDVPGHDVAFVAAERGPVIDHTGRCPLVASATFDEVTAPDVIVVPGSIADEAPQADVVAWLRRERLHDRGVAEMVQLAIEYDPQPPFDRGAPSKADPGTVELVHTVLDGAVATAPAVTPRVPSP